MTFKIPLFKVLMAAQAKDFVADVLASGHIAQGPCVNELEGRLALIIFDVPDDRVVTVNSGTSALHLAYHLVGIRPGDVVIATPMTCAATITPLVHMGAEIVWADVDSVTGNISARSVREIIALYESEMRESVPKAVVTVDWAGTPCMYEDLRRVVPRYIPIIEDAAHAFGARRSDGRTLAKAAIDDNIFICYSFQAIKHLTTGDGGALICPTPELTERARKLRWFGLDRRSGKDFRCAQDITEAGYKFHMNDIAAAIGLANLDLACNALWSHREHARVYSVEFSDTAAYPRVTPPPWQRGSSWWIYTLLVDDRAGFQKFMAEQGIETSQVHRRNDEHPAFPNRSPVSLSGLDHFAKHQVSIPVGWWLSEDDINHVIESVRTWART